MALNDRVNIQRIVLCLLRFDLWAAETITDGLDADQRLENIEHHFRHMWESPPPPTVIDAWLQSPELYESQPLPALREYRDGMSEAQLYAAIMNPSAKTFYTRLLLKRISKVLEQRTINDFASQHLERAWEESQGLLIMQRPASRSDYLVRLVHGLKESRLRLKAVTREARVFRDNIKEASRAGGLNVSALELLRGKLEALNEYYDEACHELGGEDVPEMLMDSQRPDFWNTQLQTPPPTPPLRAIDSYPEMTQLNFLPALNSLILIVCFFASIPAYLCFTSTPVGPGSSTDANFYQLLSSDMLQILSIVTLLWPTVFHARLSRMAWYWIWILAGIATMCVVLSLIFYRWVSVGWSGLLGFLGEASMGIISLMLIFRV